MSAFANFPYEVVDTDGENALAKWEELKKAGRGAPVVLGDELENLLESFGPAERRQLQPIEEILAEAKATADLKEYEAPLGEWPDEASDGLGLSVAYDITTGKPRSKVHIALTPTD